MIIILFHGKRNLINRDHLQLMKKKMNFLKLNNLEKIIIINKRLYQYFFLYI